MLLNLHVKNFALIDEADVDFTEGLNILSGETGAGKSIILGSLNMALGAKADKDSIRVGSQFALVELSFAVDNDDTESRLKELDIYPEEGIVNISRKITPQRSVFKINGESVSSSDVKKAADILIDVYGQHDYQNLLRQQKHIEILDSFADDGLKNLISEYKQTLKKYNDILGKLEDTNQDETTRERTVSLLEFQINEIESANLVSGEEEELQKKLKTLENSARIREALILVKNMLYDYESPASELVDSALREINTVSNFDEELESLANQISDMSNAFCDLSRDLNNCIDSFDVDDETLDNYRQRYELINDLERKYGRSIEDINNFLEEKKAELEELVNIEIIRKKLEDERESLKAFLDKKAFEIHDIRVNNAKLFEKSIIENLTQLNFNSCEFKVDITSSDEYLNNGTDKVTFMISTNPGEPIKPINFVASGGELSRIMLAIKTVAGKSDRQTLIFDEIDAGISGVTAWKVAEKLGRVSRTQQIICITHLQQIASMADTHYKITKSLTSDKSRTVTEITRLDREGTLDELVRMLGDESSSELFKKNAIEILDRANDYKATLK